MYSIGLSTDSNVTGQSNAKMATQSTKTIYNFHKILKSSPPTLPPCLSNNTVIQSPTIFQGKESEKLKVYIQVHPSVESTKCIAIDKHNSIVTINDPTPSRKLSSTASKSFPVDTIIDEDWPLVKICQHTLNNSIRSVVSGEDACVLSFGNISSNETNAMLGTDKSLSELGIIPSAIIWLFEFVNIIRNHDNSRFSVRMSVIEVSENQDICTDLLTDVLTIQKGNSSGCTSSVITTPVELRTVTVEKALYNLDYALNQRSNLQQSSGISYLLVTLHLYQYHMQSDSGVNGGRSRLHLLDLCHGRLSTDTKCNVPSLQAISKVILALWGGQPHIPHCDNNLIQLLQDLFLTNKGKLQTSMLFHISHKASQYDNSLQIVQLASKIFRKKMKSARPNVTGHRSEDNSSSDSFSYRRRSKIKNCSLVANINKTRHLCSDLEETSSSETSCDTVIFRGLRTSDQVEIEQKFTKEVKENKNDGQCTLTNWKLRNHMKFNNHVHSKMVNMKAMRVPKSGQELWVDGPQATSSVAFEFKRYPTARNNNSKCVESTQFVLTDELAVDQDLSKESKMISTPLDRSFLMYSRKYDNKIRVSKCLMVTNWLSNQPETTENIDISSSRKLSQFTNDRLISNRTRINKINQPTKLQEASNEKLSSKNPYRIEEWIHSVSTNSPQLTPYRRDTDIVMTQSLHSPAWTPCHTHKDSSTPSNTINQKESTHQKPTGIDANYSLHQELESHFDTKMCYRSSSFVNNVPKCCQRVEQVRRSYRKQTPVHQCNVITPASCSHKSKVNLQRYSTLPLDNYSPKHQHNASKSVKSKHNSNIKSTQNCISPLRTQKEVKISDKDVKKKETGKVLSFFNQLFKNIITKKEIVSDHLQMQDSNNQYSPWIEKQKQGCDVNAVLLPNNIEPYMISKSPYHTITAPKIQDPRTYSSGQESEYGSVSATKTADLSTDFHPETGDFKFSPSYRTASSGYMSMARDNEISSHDSVSDCSATIKASLDTHTTNDSTFVSSSNYQHKKYDSILQSEENQKIGEIIIKEKLNIITMERESLLVDLIRTMRLVNMNPEESRSKLDRNVCKMDGDEHTLASLESTNHMLQLVLNRYQSNICLVTSFLANTASNMCSHRKSGFQN